MAWRMAWGGCGSRTQARLWLVAFNCYTDARARTAKPDSEFRTPLRSWFKLSNLTISTPTDTAKPNPIGGVAGGAAAAAAPDLDRHQLVLCGDS